LTYQKSSGFSKLIAQKVENRWQQQTQLTVLALDRSFSFKTISRLREWTQLFQKVDWVLVLGMTVAVSYLFYHLYKVAQFFSHSSLGLDERFRLVKCKVLLDEAQEKATTSNVEPLLLECETLLATMTSVTSSLEKQKRCIGTCSILR
jgi:hypothetical protein